LMPHDCAGPAVNPFRLFGILSSPGWPCLIPILDAAPLVDDEALGQLGLGILVRLVGDRTRPVRVGLADQAGVIAAGAIPHVSDIEIGAQGCESAGQRRRPPTEAASPCLEMVMGRIAR